MLKLILRSTLLFVITFCARQAVVLNGLIFSSSLVVDHSSSPPTTPSNINACDNNKRRRRSPDEDDDCSNPPFNRNTTSSVSRILAAATGAEDAYSEPTPSTKNEPSPTAGEPSQRPTTPAPTKTESSTTMSYYQTKQSSEGEFTPAKSSQTTTTTTTSAVPLSLASSPLPPTTTTNNNSNDDDATTTTTTTTNTATKKNSSSYRTLLLEEWNKFENEWKDPLILKRYLKTINSKKVPPTKKFQDFIIAAPTTTSKGKRDVVLATHTSLGSDNKIDRIKIALKYWQGPISLAVRILSVEELHSFFDYYERGDDAAASLLTVHFVFEYHAGYPPTITTKKEEEDDKTTKTKTTTKTTTTTNHKTNKKKIIKKKKKSSRQPHDYAIQYCHNTLRDMALHSPSIADFVLSVDIDFVSTYGGYSKTMEILNNKQPELWNKMQYDNTLLVVPIFQMWHIPQGWKSIVRGEDPRYKDITIQQLKRLPKQTTGITRKTKTKATATITATTTTSYVRKQRQGQGQERRRLLENEVDNQLSGSELRGRVLLGNQNSGRKATNNPAAEQQRARLLRRKENPTAAAMAATANSLLADVVINLKVQRTDVEASTHIRRVKLPKIWDSKTESVSYDELIALAIGYIVPKDSNPVVSEFQVELTYIPKAHDDNDDDQYQSVVVIQNSKDLLHAIEQVQQQQQQQQQQQRVLKITAEVKKRDGTTTATTATTHARTTTTPTTTNVIRDGKLHVISSSSSSSSAGTTTSTTKTNKNKVVVSGASNAAVNKNPLRLQQFQLGVESDLPASRDMLKRMYNLQFATDFYYLPSYEPNNLTQFWKYEEGVHNATYPIEYMSKFYEPYFIGYKPRLPHYWNGFRGFGGNKQSFVRECILSGLKMEALYELYLTHLPHPLNTRDTTQALTEWKVRFKPYLEKKYPYQQMPESLKQRFQQQQQQGEQATKFSRSWYDVPI